MDTDDRLIFTPNSWKWVDETSECEPVGERSDDEDATLNIEHMLIRKVYTMSVVLKWLGYHKSDAKQMELGC